MTASGVDGEERPEVGLWALFPCRLTGTSQIRL